MTQRFIVFLALCVVLAMSSCSRSQVPLSKSNRTYMKKFIPELKNIKQLNLAMIEEHLCPRGEPVFENVYTWFIQRQYEYESVDVEAGQGKRIKRGGATKGKKMRPRLKGFKYIFSTDYPQQDPNYLRSNPRKIKQKHWLAEVTVEIVEVDGQEEIRQWNMIWHKRF